jgi:histidine triad (HIT) family protein
MTISCPFCSIEDPNQIIVFERDLVLFSQNVKHQGSLKHSGIIIPKAHRETAFDLTREEWDATYELLQDVRSWMDSNLSPAGYNLGWNCGTVAGQQVAHAHLHVMPRFPGEPLAGQGIRSLLKSEANRW